MDHRKFTLLHSSGSQPTPSSSCAAVMEDQAHKPHRKAKVKSKHASGQPNPRAFAYAKPGKLSRTAARSHDIKEKRLHVPLVDRLPDEPPPKLVAIVGPPGVGKTTLLRSLIRRYAKETITHPVGPVTIVTSKKQRLCFVECPNSLESMVDIAHVADIVLLLIDGNYGFEMETMEFLNILAATGMPGNIMGVLTHLDLFTKPYALRDAKKRLKHRLWNELYKGAHLFYLSGVINGRYPDREVFNLSRYLSVMKNPRPLVFRNSHAYAVVDNYRDITHPTKIEEDARCDRTVELSGYLRGTNLAAQGQRVHIPGLGDFTIASVEILPDPCPTPAMQAAEAKVTGKTGRRRLDEKDKKLHAPMSDRSGLKIVGDHVYITREKGFTFDKNAEDVERGEGEQLIIDLQAERRLLGQSEKGVQLFAGGEEVEPDVEEDSGRRSRRQARFAEYGDDDVDEEMPEDEGFVSGENDSDAELEQDFDEAELEQDFDETKLGKVFRPSKDTNGGNGDVAFADSDSDIGELSADEGFQGEDVNDDEDLDSGEEAAAVRWKDGMAERAGSQLAVRAYRAADLARYLYDQTLSLGEAIRKWRGEPVTDDTEEETEGVAGDEDDQFFRKTKVKDEELQDDRVVPVYDYDALANKWSEAGNVEALRRRFATSRLLEDGDEADEEGDGFGEEDEMNGDDEGDGAFEDLETGEKHGPELSLEEERAKNAQRKEELKLRFEEEDKEGFMNDKANAKTEAAPDEQFGEDEWYDAQKALIQKQLDINKSEYEELDERQRAAMEGFRAGKYAKMVLEGVPAEFFERFDPHTPLIVGGLSATEDRFGFVQLRIKRHRWHKKILKTNDPLIFSLGWRRFQALPTYSISDSRTRNRLLKYTPEHMHCFATIYGPLSAPNTGFACFQSFSPATPGFRIAATGTVLSVDETTDIVKKLKLTGTPAKIFKNSAFISGMFNSALEIAKFEGAAVRTVSGVRGQIKRALAKPEGHFRATFEDKILSSDIVFLRAWYPVKPRVFYNPATNLIGWKPMRLTGEVRRDEGIPTPQVKNSQYRKIERPVRHFNSLKVPRALAADLPFRSQIVQTKKQGKQTYMQKRAVVLGGEERKARDLIVKLNTLRKDAAEKRRAKKEEGRKEFRKKVAELEEKRERREKRERDQFWEREGRKRKNSEAGGGGKRRR